MQPRQASRGKRATSLLLVLWLTAALSPAPAGASEGSEFLISLISPSGDFIGGGDDRFFTPGNASIQISGTAESITVYAQGGSAGDETWRLDFGAPRDRQLVPGAYESVREALAEQDHDAALDIHGDGRGCEVVDGRFDVLAIESDSADRVTSFWAVFEQHCDRDPQALIGEVRFNVPGDGGGLAVTPRQIRWPDTEIGVPRQSVPVTVANVSSAPIAIGTAGIVGADAASFQVAGDGCSDSLLSVAATCQIQLTMNDAKAGGASASLLIPETDLVHEVGLSGWTLTGDTRLSMTSDPGDVFGGGQNYEYSPQSSSFEVRADSNSIWGQVWGEGDDWLFEFAGVGEEELVVGGTYDWVRVDGTPSTDCADITGEFTIQELSFTSYDDLEELALTFEQRCGSSTAALRGSLHYRFGADHRPLEPDPSAPGLPPVRYDRTVGLRLGTYGLIGRLRSDSEACYASARVEIQRLTSEGWRNLIWTETHEDGRFGKGNIRKGHVFRAVAPRSEGENIICPRAVSRRVSS